MLVDFIFFLVKLNIKGNLMRAGDNAGYNYMAHMYTLEYAIKKSEYQKKIQGSPLK